MSRNIKKETIHCSWENDVPFTGGHTASCFDVLTTIETLEKTVYTRNCLHFNLSSIFTSILLLSREILSQTLADPAERPHLGLAANMQSKSKNGGDSMSHGEIT